MTRTPPHPAAQPARSATQHDALDVCASPPDPEATLEGHFRFVALENDSAPALSPAEVIRGVWEGHIAAGDYELAIVRLEDSDE